MLFKTNKKFLILFLLIILILVFVILVYAQACCRLNHGSTTNMCYHSAFRRVTNSHGQAIFAPTGSSGEWTSFLNNRPSGVTATVIGCCNDATCGSLSDTPICRTTDWTCVACLINSDCHSACIDAFWGSTCMYCENNNCQMYMDIPDCAIYCETGT